MMPPAMQGSLQQKKKILPVFLYICINIILPPKLYNIWGFHGGYNSYCGVLSYDTMQSGRWAPTYQRITGTVYIES